MYIALCSLLLGLTDEYKHVSLGCYHVTIHIVVIQCVVSYCLTCQCGGFYVHRGLLKPEAVMKKAKCLNIKHMATMVAALREICPTDASNQTIPYKWDQDAALIATLQDKCKSVIYKCGILISNYKNSKDLIASKQVLKYIT